MFEVGSRVTLGANGVSVLRVTEIVDDNTVIVLAEADAPGAYPFPTPISRLFPVKDIDN